MAHKMTRREFVKKAAAGTAGMALVGAGLLSPSKVLGANDRISIGVVGPGQRARLLMCGVRRLAEECNVEITAVCDIWTMNLDRGAKMVQEWCGREPRKFRHFEDMLALKDLDGVIIGAADFQHAKMLAQAVRAGKDVYCEKPMANDLKDARKALEAVEETGRIVQLGTQRRSEGRYPAAAQMIESGILGTVSKVDIQWNHFGPRWRRGDVNEVKEEDTDWKRFLMGKKYRPFDPHQYMEWRLFRDFSSGIPDQWLSHMIDTVHMVMGERFPKSAVAHGGVYVWKDGRENADTFHALLEYPKGFLVSFSTKFGNSAGDCMLVYGTKGILDLDSGKITDNGGGDERVKEEITIQAPPKEDHIKNWLDCMRSRKQPNADVYSGYSQSVATMMAARALRSGKKVFYDPVKQEMDEA